MFIKKLIPYGLLFLLIVCGPSQKNSTFVLSQESIEKKIALSAAFQKDRSSFLFHNADSPLGKTWGNSKAELSYFPVNKKFLTLGKIQASKEIQKISLGNSDGGIENYYFFGKIIFLLGEKSYTLSVFQDPNKGSLFCPFTDKGKGKTVYAGGRYVDLEFYEENTYILNFNKAVNPYCAYDPKWICALPPKENHLALNIEAGEKEFKELKKKI